MSTSTAASSQFSEPLRKFTRFPDLPAELRIAIWNIAIYSIPVRVLDLDLSVSTNFTSPITAAPIIFGQRRETILYSEQILKRVAPVSSSLLLSCRESCIETKKSIEQKFRHVLDQPRRQVYGHESSGLGGSREIYHKSIFEIRVNHDYVRKRYSTFALLEYHWFAPVGKDEESWKSCDSNNFAFLNLHLDWKLNTTNQLPSFWPSDKFIANLFTQCPNLQGLIISTPLNYCDWSTEINDMGIVQGCDYRFRLRNEDFNIWRKAWEEDIRIKERRLYTISGKDVVEIEQSYAIEHERALVEVYRQSP